MPSASSEIVLSWPLVLVVQMKVFSHCKSSCASRRTPIPKWALDGVILFSNSDPGRTLFNWLGTRNPVAIASTCPDRRAWLIPPSSSNRWIVAVLGAVLTIIGSATPVRTTPIRVVSEDVVEISAVLAV